MSKQPTAVAYPVFDDVSYDYEAQSTGRPINQVVGMAAMTRTAAPTTSAQGTASMQASSPNQPEYSMRREQPTGDTLTSLEASVRRGFIRKVYAILSVQLLVTFGAVFLAQIDREAAIAFINQNRGIYYGALAVAFISIIALSCCMQTARKFPTNYIFLGLFTIAESILLAVVGLRYSIDTVLMALGATAAIVFALTLFACQTKYDFTGAGPYLFVALVVFFLFGIVAIFFFDDFGVRIAYAAIGTLLFSMFLVYDTQMIIGGQHKKFEFGVDDYVFAALNLYLDIINLFQYMLLFLGGDD